MDDAVTRGRFVWHDLMTTDPAKAEAFYTTVAGWGTQPWNDAGFPYTLWTANGNPLGGVIGIPPDVSAPPHWIAYIAVPDVDATALQVTLLGGRIYKAPEDIPKVGRFAILADPQGAVFAAFTPLSGSRPVDTPPAVGEFSWHELMTDDYETAWSFYEAIFGWQRLAEEDIGALGIYLVFGRNGRQEGGMFNKNPEVPMRSNWLHYIRVDSADRVADVVKTNGGTIMNGPMDVPGGDRIAQCADPQGAFFAIHSSKAS
jgi:uncharacterized protein